MTAEPLIRPAREAGQVLADAFELIGPGLREAVARLPDRIRQPVGVHLGWWDGSGLPLDGGRAGKMIRPALTLLACNAVGAQSAAGAPAAVAVELVHNASLLHDDLIDQDRMRRGRPAVWAELGMPAAVLAGDALFFLAMQVLASAPPPLGTAGVEELTGAVQELIEGEYTDVLLEEAQAATAAESEAMAAGKTGALIAAACALGALAGGADTGGVGHLRAFGAHLGLAFQWADDLLGIWGDPHRTGKPAGSDLRARKKTLPVTAAITTGGTAGRELARLYADTEPMSPATVRRATDLLETAGSRDSALREAERHIATALHHLHAVNPPAATAAELSRLARLTINRDN
ncbi:polyprenyl synthetase family protein [Streptomyces altiplanensis]